MSCSFFLQNIGYMVLHILSAHKTLTFKVIQRNFMNCMRMFKTLVLVILVMYCPV